MEDQVIEGESGYTHHIDGECPKGFARNSNGGFYSIEEMDKIGTVLPLWGPGGLTQELDCLVRYENHTAEGALQRVLIMDYLLKYSGISEEEALKKVKEYMNAEGIVWEVH